MTTYVVSDLHLGGERDDPRRTGPAFVDFLHDVVMRGSGGVRLVLLGDMLELAAFRAAARGEREMWAVRQLELLAVRHAAVFAALRECAQAGVRLDIVAGNHDVDLLRPRVRERLRELLNCAAPVHPWALHVPGLLHATHGHQHHDLSRSPTLLMATLPGAPGELPVPPLAALAWSRHHGRGHLAAAAAVIDGIRATRQAERIAGGPAYTELIDREAAVLGLTPQTGRALAQVSRFRILSTAARLTRVVTARRFGATDADGYLRRAAADLADALSHHGAAVPFLLFGHTHRARIEPIRGRAAWYVNSGTWSSAVRGDDAPDPTLFPYVRITESDSHPTASIEHWATGPTRPPRTTVATARSTAPVVHRGTAYA